MSYVKKPRFKPSIVCSPCLRKIFYSYNQIPEDYPFPLANKRICELGDYIHQMLSNNFRKAGILIDYRNANGKIPINKFSKEPDPEFPIKDPDLEISLKIDAILKLSGTQSLTTIFNETLQGKRIINATDDQKLWIGEYKSINDRGFKELEKLNAPKTAHILQAIIYYFLFNHALKEGKFKHIKELDGFTEVSGIRFLYYNKNNSTMKEFIYAGNQDIFIELIKKMQQIKQYTASQELPPKEWDFCKSCSWRKKCMALRLK